MFVTTNHRGGIGNVLFKLAAVISLAKDNNVDYVFPNQFLRPNDPDFTKYSNNILRNIKFIPNLEESYKIWSEPTFHYTKIPYDGSFNILLDGHFQSEKYFINHKDEILNIFSIPLDLKEHIITNIPEISNYCSIHIRRGDYLNFPDTHPQQPSEYYQQAVEEIGEDKHYLIFSDDIEWCEKNFDFIKNKSFSKNNEDWVDLYLMSLCNDNIITNSSFSWWGAYLNQNPNKKVIGPNIWFGERYSHWDTKDVIPSKWIKI